MCNTFLTESAFNFYPYINLHSANILLMKIIVAALLYTLLYLLTLKNAFGCMV